jgi:hypothetical protein
VVALLPLGAYAVHQGRYLLMPGSERAAAHGYLAVAPALLALLLAVALAYRLEGAARRRSSGRTRWLPAAAWSAAALVMAYVGQELAEALVTPGAPLPFAAGGWVAVPLALMVGAVLALALRVDSVADGVLDRVMRPAIAVAPAAGALQWGCPTAPARPRPGPLAARSAGRAPPLRS